MPHPLVPQLRFTRSEFKRALEGLTDAEARQTLHAHELHQLEHRPPGLAGAALLAVARARSVLLPHVNEQFAYGAPASTPPLDEMWQPGTPSRTPPIRGSIRSRPPNCNRNVVANGEPLGTNWGTLLQRVIYHYWYHTGENMAIRQNLGHTDLPEFVGDIDSEAPYRAE